MKKSRFTEELIAVVVKAGLIRGEINTHRRKPWIQIKNILSTEVVQIFRLQDDLELLNLMIADSKSQPALYNPGPYWTTKAKNAVNKIKRCGLAALEVLQTL